MDDPDFGKACGWTSLEEAKVQGEELLRRAGVAQAIEIAGSIRYVTRFSAVGAIDGGGAKVGGTPDVAPGFEWPRFADSPMAHLCQLELSDVHAVGGDSELPPKGRLLFFYDLMTATRGGDPKHKGAWQVVYEDSISVEQAPTPIDLPKMHRVPKSRIVFYRAFDLPPLWNERLVGQVLCRTTSISGYAEMIWLPSDSIKYGSLLNPKHRAALPKWARGGARCRLASASCRWSP